MKKSKRILGSAVFLSIGLTLAIMTSYVLRPLFDDFHRNRFTGFYAEEDDSLDVVGLGSSALFCYFSSPALYENTGITSYALSTPWQPVATMEYLIDEVLKTQSPQLLIVEARKFLLAGEKEVKANQLRMITDNMNYSANRAALINGLVDGWGKRLPFYFDIMLYHENWEILSSDSLTYIFNNKPDPLKGWINIGRFKALEKPDIVAETEELPLSETNENALLDIMKKCKENDLEVLFVLSPYQISPKSQKRANYMKRIVEEQGFRFLDCNRHMDEMGIDFGTDFLNKKHTNAIGADKYTKYLGEYILENYDIDTDHSPEVTADWDEVVERNRALYEAAKEEIYRIADGGMQTSGQDQG